MSRVIRVLIPMVALLCLMPAVAFAQPADTTGTFKPVACKPESLPYLNGITLNGDHIYWQRDGQVMDWSSFLELKRGSLHEVQVDTWELEDEGPIIRIDSLLVPLWSIERGHRSGFSEQMFRFQGMFWRHMPFYSEGRLGRWHIWTLKIGVQDLEKEEWEYKPFCTFLYWVYFYDQDW